MNLDAILRRFALPGFLVSLHYYWKYRCLISPKAEVEVGTGLVVGRGTKVGSYTKIKASEGPLVIGANTAIGPGCCISSGSKGMTIGNNCLISPHVTILGNNYRYDRLDMPIVEQGLASKGVKISDNVWIGAGVVVLDGSDVGNGAIITPNSVVSGKIPPNVIVQGNPAKVVFERR